MITSTATNPVLTPLKVLVIGPPGARKTTFLLGIPNIHIMDCDRNLEGPERYIRQHVNPNLTYTYDPIRYNEQGVAIDTSKCYERLCDKLKAVRNDEAYKSVRSVAVDSLSHVNEFIICHVLRMQAKEKKVGEMEARDWGPFKSYAYALLVGRLEETLRNVFCTCHEIKLTVPDKQNLMQQIVTGYEPFFQGKVGDTIGAFFTDVWRLDVVPSTAGRTKHILQTQRIPKCDHLKNSLGMPEEIDVTEGFKVLEPYLKGRV